jgi:hypothetical protein
MSPTSGGSYKLSIPERERDRLSKWVQRAKELGLRKRLLDALESIQENLRNRPLRWGDPQYHLKAMGLMMFRGLADFVQVNYGVDRVRRIVYISEFKLLPWSRFDQHQ